ALRSLRGGGRQPSCPVRIRNWGARNRSIWSAARFRDRLLHPYRSVPHDRCHPAFLLRVSGGLRCRSFYSSRIDRRVNPPTFPMGSPWYLRRLGAVWSDWMVRWTSDHGGCAGKLAGRGQAAGAALSSLAQLSCHALQSSGYDCTSVGGGESAGAQRHDLAAL